MSNSQVSHLFTWQQRNKGMNKQANEQTNEQMSAWMKKLANEQENYQIQFQGLSKEFRGKLMNWGLLTPRKYLSNEFQTEKMKIKTESLRSRLLTIICDVRQVSKFVHSTWNHHVSRYVWLTACMYIHIPPHTHGGIQREFRTHTNIHTLHAVTHKTRTHTYT